MSAVRRFDDDDDDDGGAGKTRACPRRGGVGVVGSLNSRGTSRTRASRVVHVHTLTRTYTLLRGARARRCRDDGAYGRRARLSLPVAAGACACCARACCTCACCACACAKGRGGPEGCAAGRAAGKTFSRRGLARSRKRAGRNTTAERAPVRFIALSTFLENKSAQTSRVRYGHYTDTRDGYDELPTGLV